MKLIKRILLLIAALFMAGSLCVLVCALNPSLTAALAEKVQQMQAGPSRPDQEQSLPFTPVISEDSAGEKYIVPDSYPQEIPGEVSGLTGYQKITAENELIGQEEADNLGSVLAPGESGENFSFPAEFYPYYAILDNTLKTLYRQVYANALALNTSFTPGVAVTTAQAASVVEAVYNDHPELFWMDAEFSCKYLRTGICVEITLKYNETANDLAAAKQDFDACAAEILAGAASLGSDYEKEQYIHDALVQIVEYKASTPIDQSAYSAIVLGQSVCAGYSKAFQYLMQQLGIPCYYCTGYAGEDHAWNIVKTGSLYRNVDVTWDDTEPATYKFFNKTDEDYADTHMRRGLAQKLPACEGINYRNLEEEPDAAAPTPTPSPQVTPAPTSAPNNPMISAELEEYYRDCGQKIIDNGLGSSSFVQEIDAGLWQELWDAYNNGNISDSFLIRAMNRLGGSSCSVQIQCKVSENGGYRLTHTVYIQ